MKNQIFDLQRRLINFAISIMEIVELLPKTYTGTHFKKQLVRSGTAPALLYGEAQAAESRKDFVHKMKIGLKELRESYITLTIILEKPLIKNQKAIGTLNECDELISIFFTSITTAKQNMKKR
ncbi:MAG: four helix bundle protein [Gracilimonas sp.]|uniref:Four helix bundle protein n=1 Tax=Gracilimonas sediminicola TaxID=2952158 RepID=A0A9X2L2F2_9BACT|nr:MULTISPECIES: four helix bundle protein [Gracilimonas]MBO6584666.1 four helix bundle protein [Gracilimonas sp.]MBO6616063.1 four helix bundle protein [Gracilimonas sp.]MCP9291113.1 four helix bundle protein [Gracilimonas sediminicola]